MGQEQKLREMAEANDMSCLGTHYDTGETYFGHWGVFIPKTMMHQVLMHKVLIRLGKKLQEIQSTTLRDHMPLLLRVRACYASGGDNDRVRWDRDKMMDLLVGKADRIPFLQSVEKHMESAREALDKNLCVDTMTDNIWHGMNEAMHKAALEHFIVGEKEEHKEMKELKTERREMLSRRWELRQKVIEKENNNEHEMEMNELEEAQFRLSTICLKMKKMYKAERKLKEKRWEEELAIAWSNYNVSKSWRVTRRIARSQKGVKKRGYATTCMPTKEEWITHLSRPGP